PRPMTATVGNGRASGGERLRSRYAAPAPGPVAATVRPPLRGAHVSQTAPTLTAGRDTGLTRPIADEVGWTDTGVRAVDTVRVLAADAVQHAGHGHPGTAMSLAPLAYLLYQNVM